LITLETTDLNDPIITDNETGQDIFVHSTGLKEDIHEGDEVTFEVTQGKKGLNAINVQLAS